jgi:hypothetical protein
LIINGAMTVAQRGTSFSSITSDQYTLDRWTSSSAVGVSLSVSQQTATSSDDAYFASKHFARYQRNAVLSGFVHKVENLQQFNNKTFTLSFWAKSSDAGTNVTVTTYTVNDGSSFNSYVTQTYVTNPTLSSTWQKYEIRLAFQDMYTYGYSGSHHLRLQFFDGNNAATFDISEVQLELGDTATPFEHRSFGDELARCQRYYQQVGGAGNTLALGQCVSSTSAQFFYPLPYPIRADATVSVSDATHFRVFNATISGIPQVTSMTFTSTGSATNNGFRIIANVASGLSAGNASHLYGNNASANAGIIKIDAEL